jgi:hypothetical protein
MNGKRFTTARGIALRATAHIAFCTKLRISVTTPHFSCCSQLQSEPDDIQPGQGTMEGTCVSALPKSRSLAFSRSILTIKKGAR